jgi:hypothetical protein
MTPPRVLRKLETIVIREKDSWKTGGGKGRDSESRAAVLNVGYVYPLGVGRESSKVATSSNKVAKLADYPVKCL